MYYTGDFSNKVKFEKRENLVCTNKNQKLLILSDWVVTETGKLLNSFMDLIFLRNIMVTDIISSP